MRLLLPYENPKTNIVTQAELRHQRYIIRNSRSGWLWIVLAMLMLLPAFITSVLLFGMAATETSLRTGFISIGNNTPLVSMSGIGLTAVIIMNIALYMVVTLITVALGANSISREKTSKTWNILLLTNVDARSLVLCKWYASFKSLRGDHFMVVLLRLGFMGFIVSFNLPNLPQAPFDLPVGIAFVIPLTIIIVLFTLVEAGFSAALGIAGALSEYPGAVNTSFVLAIRVVGMVWAALFFVNLSNMLLSGRPYLLFAVFGLGISAFATWVTLVTAQDIAMRGQVSPPA
jgi:hypothetical protein